MTVWDLGSLRRVVRFEGHVRPRAIGHAWREIDDQIRMLAGRTVLNLATPVENAVWSVAFSPDGRLAASCDADGSARVWDAATGRERLRLDHREGPPFWPLAAAWVWAVGWGSLR